MVFMGCPAGRLFVCLCNLPLRGAVRREEKHLDISRKKMYYVGDRIGRFCLMAKIVSPFNSGL